ncbi:MAG: GyrI-like domain-containing protein [Oscillospiraceae bacterium]|jgi:hypothetical protein|nr:GyrI-like domain-containing protein [Oscillospiraceae bacterium]
MPIDFKKTQKEIYMPKTIPNILDVPEMVYFAVDGQGDPNTSIEYKSAIKALYSLSYTIKMSYKSGKQPEGFYEYVVPPLEGFWQVDDNIFNGDSVIKSKFLWTSVIRQPEFVTEKVFLWAKEILATKKPNVDTSKVYLWKNYEGLCGQIMYIGSYDTESNTIQTLTDFIEKSGYKTDISVNRRHHEIYLTDPRKTVPEKLKTVIRYPIAKI